MSLFSLAPSPDILIDGSPSGSACCVWRDGLLQYVLTAAHVLEHASPDAAIVWVGIDGAVGYGQLSKAHPYWAAVEGGVQDAGLITVSELGSFASPSAYPWGSSPVAWRDAHRARSVMICGKYSQVYATFDRRLVGSNPVQSHVYGRLLQFRFDGSTTRPGDSGAPVISLPEGTLVGMHVVHHVDGPEQYSWVVSADDIMTTLGGLSGFRLRP
jgi:Trypsin